jgi:hypothetical protein
MSDRAGFGQYRSMAAEHVAVVPHGSVFVSNQGEVLIACSTMEA